jgi:hypothetical protein
VEKKGLYLNQEPDSTRLFQVRYTMRRYFQEAGCAIETEGVSPLFRSIDQARSWTERNPPRVEDILSIDWEIYSPFIVSMGEDLPEEIGLTIDRFSVEL